jgi:Avidin family
MQRSMMFNKRESMNKQIIFRAVMGALLLSGYVAAEAKPPTCAEPLGKWNDDTKSVVEITTYDMATGAISGVFIDRRGSGSSPMVGWISPAPVEPNAPGKDKGDHGDVFTLLVRWSDRGAVTAWTGTCAVNPKSGLAQISTLWHTARPNTSVEWDHIITGPEVLIPIE